MFEVMIFFPSLPQMAAAFSLPYVLCSVIFFFAVSRGDTIE